MNATAAAAPRTRAGVWIAGARPRTLGASVVPVVVAVALSPTVAWGRAGLALVVAVGLQVGVNYANDYSDGVRGVDRDRIGPLRLVASGLASPRAVARAAALAFATAAAAGLGLALAADPRLLAAGAAAIVAAILYSGGPRPYAGLGLGEAAVFVFFGPVAVCGAVYAISERLPAAAWWAAAPIGLLAVAILVANNVRDIAGDAAAGRRTLAVRLGDRGSRALYRGVVAAAFAVVAAGAAGPLPAAALVAWAALPLAAGPLRAIGSATGPALVPVLLASARLHAAFGALLAAGSAAAR